METSTSHVVDPVKEDDPGVTEPHAVHYGESMEEEDAGGSEPRTAHLAAPDEASAAAVSRSMLVAVSAEDGLATDLRALCFNIPEEVSVPAEASSVHSIVFVQEFTGKETYDLLFPAPVWEGTAGMPPQYVAPAAPTRGDGGRTETDSGGKERRSVHFPALGEHGFTTCRVKAASGGVLRRVKAASGRVPRRVKATSGGVPRRVKAASGAVPRRVQDATGGREAASGAVPRRAQDATGGREAASGAVPHRVKAASGAVPRRVQDATGGREAASGAVQGRVQDATGGREAASGAVPRRVQAAAGGRAGCAGGEPRPRVNKRKASVPVRRVDAAGEVSTDLSLFKCPHYLLMYLCEVCNAQMDDQHRMACRMLYRHHEKLRLSARQERVRRLNAQLQAERESEDLSAKRMNARKEEEEDADDDCSGDDDDDTTSDSDDEEGAHGGRRVYRVS